MLKNLLILCCMVPVFVGCQAPAPEDMVERADAPSQDTEHELVGEAQNAIASNDIRWAIQHGAASAACAAASPENDSWNGHIVIAKPAGVTCSAACAANTSGSYTNCRTAIAVGTIRMTQAADYTDRLAENYRYKCSSAFGGDEVLGQGADANGYTTYCCCY